MIPPRPRLPWTLPQHPQRARAATLSPLARWGFLRPTLAHGRGSGGNGSPLTASGCDRVKGSKGRRKPPPRQLAPRYALRRCPGPWRHKKGLPAAATQPPNAAGRRPARVTRKGINTGVKVHSYFHRLAIHTETISFYS